MNSIEIKNTMRHHALKGVVWERRSCFGCSGSYRTFKGAVAPRHNHLDYKKGFYNIWQDTEDNAHIIAKDIEN